ncbi:MAG: hypothetical protein AAGA03_00940 [Planctomycetota bacterium]
MRRSASVAIWMVTLWPSLAVMAETDLNAVGSQPPCHTIAESILEIETERSIMLGGLAQLDSVRINCRRRAEAERLLAETEASKSHRTVAAWRTNAPSGATIARLLRPEAMVYEVALPLPRRDIRPMVAKSGYASAVTSRRRTLPVRTLGYRMPTRSAGVSRLSERSDEEPRRSPLDASLVAHGLAKGSAASQPKQVSPTPREMVRTAARRWNDANDSPPAIQGPDQHEIGASDGTERASLSAGWEKSTATLPETVNTSLPQLLPPRFDVLQTGFDEDETPSILAPVIASPIDGKNSHSSETADPVIMSAPKSSISESGIAATSNPPDPTAVTIVEPAKAVGGHLAKNDEPANEHAELAIADGNSIHFEGRAGFEGNASMRSIGGQREVFAGHLSDQVQRHPPVDRIAQRIAQWPLKLSTLGLGGDPIDTGEEATVTLNVNDTDVRSVFEMLARGYQMNILVSPEVKGTVTANVDGLTPQQTLVGILKMCNLQAQYDEGLIFVYPADRLPDEATQLQMFPLDFARAETLEPTIQALLSPVGTAHISKLDSADNLRTSEAIVVIDLPERLAQIERYILQADQSPRQVMIEANVLEVELEDDLLHGINFDAVLGGDLSVGGFGFADVSASRTNPAFFAVANGTKVQALLDLLETTTDAKTLASPRVMVVNGQNARIQVGQQLGFTVATVTQTSTVQDVRFLDTGVVLNVTPTISRDNRILMQVKPEVSEGEINPDTLLPEEETREVETSVLLDDHCGVVIGGLIQENDRTVIRKLPWLGDVKHIGKFFQRREVNRKRTEIVITLVAHVIDHGPASTRDAIRYDQADTELFHGPLRRNCRPWEPRLPDALGSERHLDVQEVNRRLP